LIVVRARAYNTYGPGDYSYINTTGVQLRTVPHKMLTPTRDASSDGQEIVVNWLTLTTPANGDSAILSYNLVWNAGSGITDQNVVGFNNLFVGT
jgi:hypothetical protein